MPSSTSNSDSRLPRGPWLATWIVALAIAGIGLGSWEWYWRSRGWVPMVTGEEVAWVSARLRVRPASTVLVGTSRTGAAIDPLIWADLTGAEPPITLALRGESALPVLADLAADTSFRGLVVAEMLSTETFSERIGRGSFVAAAKEARVSPAKRWEAFLRLEGPGRWVFRRTELLPGRLATHPWPPEPVAYLLRRDQFRPTDFQLVGLRPNQPKVFDTLEFRGVRRWGTPVIGAKLDRRLDEIRASVTRIQRRGGEVVFVYLAGCGARRVMEELVYPRARYWERLHDIGVPMIHSDDSPEIAGLPCYDGSHVDIREVPLVTRWLARWVVRNR